MDHKGTRSRSRSHSPKRYRERDNDGDRRRYYQRNDDSRYTDRREHTRTTSNDRAYHSFHRDKNKYGQRDRQLQSTYSEEVHGSHGNDDRRSYSRNSPSITKFVKFQFTQHDDRTEHPWLDVELPLSSNVGNLRDAITKYVASLGSSKETLIGQEPSATTVPIILYSLNINNDTYRRLYAAMSLEEAGLLVDHHSDQEAACANRIVWAKSGESQPSTSSNQNKMKNSSQKSQSQTNASSSLVSSVAAISSSSSSSKRLPISSEYSFKYSGQRPTRSELNELEIAFGGGTAGADPCIESWLEGDTVPLGKQQQRPFV
jgi:hypothetical protein